MIGQPRHFVDRVGHVNDWQAQLGLQSFQIGENFSLARCVQRGQWLVKQQQAWAGSQRPGDGHALTFAARQFVRPTAEQVGNAQQVQGVIPVVVALRRRCSLEAVLQISLHVQVLKQTGFLKHVAQRALVHGFENGFCTVLPYLALHADSTSGAGLKTGQDPQSSCFARAGRPKQRADAIPRQVKVQVQREVPALQKYRNLQAGWVAHAPAPLRRAPLYMCSASSTTKLKASMTAANR